MFLNTFWSIYKTKQINHCRSSTQTNSSSWLFIQQNSSHICKVSLFFHFRYNVPSAAKVKNTNISLIQLLFPKVSYRSVRVCLCPTCVSGWGVQVKQQRSSGGNQPPPAGIRQLNWITLRRSHSSTHVKPWAPSDDADVGAVLTLFSAHSYGKLNWSSHMYLYLVYPSVGCGKRQQQAHWRDTVTQIKMLMWCVHIVYYKVSLTLTCDFVSVILDYLCLLGVKIFCHFGSCPVCHVASSISASLRTFGVNAQFCLFCYDFSDWQT